MLWQPEHAVVHAQAAKCCWEMQLTAANLQLHGHDIKLIFHREAARGIYTGRGFWHPGCQKLTTALSRCSEQATI